MGWGNIQISYRWVSILAVWLTTTPAFGSTCRLVIKKALSVIRSAESHPSEFLNLGWSGKDIADSAFDEGSQFLERIHPKLMASQSQKLNAFTALQESNRRLSHVYREQSQIKKFNRQALDEAKSALHGAIETYLPLIGVELYRRRKLQHLGPTFTYISLEGTHHLNRAARAIHEEFGLHLLITGRNLSIVSNTIQIPPNIFASPTGHIELIQALSSLLAQAHQVPAAFVHIQPHSHPRMQDAQGQWRLLDWNKLIGHTVRMKFHDTPPSEATTKFITKSEILEVTRSTLQKVSTLETYALKMPSSKREIMVESIAHRMSQASKPFVYIGIQIGNHWVEVWPTDSEPANLQSMSRYITTILQDSRFLKSISSLPELRFQIFLGAHEPHPITAADFELIETLEVDILGTLSENITKFPPTFIHSAKITPHEDGILIFEPVIPKL